MKTHSLQDGSLFEGKGNIKTGVLYNGNGTVYYPNGSSFKGKIRDGIRTGHGTYSQNEDFRYTGEWINDIFHGKGVWETCSPTSETNIQHYSGDFQNGIMTGSAVVSYTGGYVYRGDVVNGYRAGQGVLEDTCRVLYRGYWAHNNYHGFGHRYYENGEYYVGYFKNGKRHGRGKYGSSHTNMQMDAEWRDDIPYDIYSGELPETKIYMEADGTYKEHRIRECVICLDKEPAIVYLPCRHFCTCVSCPRQTYCPICRASITDAIYPIYS